MTAIILLVSEASLGAPLKDTARLKAEARVIEMRVAVTHVYRKGQKFVVFFKQTHLTMDIFIWKCPLIFSISTM